MKASVRDTLFSILCFIFPFSIYFITQSSSLMFDDASEFATVINLGSIAHPPGTPAYILSGFLWNKLFLLFTDNHVFILNLFSISCSSIASLLFYKTTRMILNHSFGNNLSYWTWSNTIEVYAFQVLSMSMLLYGLVHFQTARKNKFLVWAAVGYAFGLSNHHLTVILFTPFIPFFFFNNLFAAVHSSVSDKKDKKKKISQEKKSFAADYMAVLKSKPIWMMAAIAAVITIGFYSWMYIRAQHDYPFMFGKPDTFQGMFYHVSGGSYSKHLDEASTNLILSRIPYFLQLTFFQYLFFFPLVIGGLFFMIRKKMFRFFSVVFFYFLMLFVYQINNNQWENTDAYMLLPFMLLTIPVAFAAMEWFDFLKLKYVLPLAIIAQTVINFPKCDRRNYNISESLMHMLNTSAPKNSIIIISDWSLVMQYYYSRIVENFRPDLVVLNQDIKFNHYKVIQILYPEFYKSIQPEFDKFIDELSKEHPEQVTNTGCDLSTPALMNAFHKLITRIELLAQQENRTLLTDPHAHDFLSKQELYDPERYVSGCFVSSVKSDLNDEFLKFDMKWLKSDLLMNDLTALNKMVDYQAMFDYHIGYFTYAGDSARLAMAEAGKEKVMRIQRELKKHISFAYKFK
ncbi:MAG: DUF2723 domain-containing protein [Bacteroidetes bacterium]|nr:DUF2723 domain-containing protein [Bacteroidota bacterium]